MFSCPSEFIVHLFRKLGFCSVSFNATLALVGQLCKTLHRASLGSDSLSAFPIHTYWIQQHANFLLRLVSRSWTESHQVSMNDIFMRLSTRHNSTTGGRIDKPSTPLVSWHAITSSRPSPLHFHGPMSSLCIGFIN